jgi:predicted RNA-binding Zn-ribbon protein involved in translation (DUF1610 family)
MNLIDSKYIGLISARLQKFKRVKADLYNFRCPICGDSQRYKNKARGYIYAMKNDTNFKCHNCGASMSFNNFIKKIDGALHKRYVMERFKQGLTGKATVVEDPVFEFEKPKFKAKLDLPKCSKVDRAREYLKQRKLDSNQFYYADKFKTFVNSIKPTFKDTKNEEPRIVIPLWYQGELVGIQGRALSPHHIKYITIMFSEDPLTALSSTIAWLCVALTVTFVVLREAIAFILLITSPVMARLLDASEELYLEAKKSSSGQQA